MKSSSKKTPQDFKRAAARNLRKGGVRWDWALGLIVLAVAALAKIFLFPSDGKVGKTVGKVTQMKVEQVIKEDNSPLQSAFGNINKDAIPKGANPEGKPREAIKDCLDRHQECKAFKDNGECHINPGWMIINCPRSCNDITDACRLRDPKLRCDRRALNMTIDPVYRPGDMYRMFETVERRFGNRYGPVTVYSRDPFIVTFENFVSEEEADALIDTIPRWERSTDSGSMNEFGESGRILSQGRTSSNGWCVNDCERHPKVRKLLRKIEEVTGVPSQNYESFQVLKYEPGQFYRTHHDYGADDVALACGPRILTFFLYLSDVEDGGETNFPTLGISVKPKKGRALLWPSTLDHDPEMQDVRTMHEAKVVHRGLKYAANSWIHLYDYAKPNLWGCTGSFDEL